jgi:hypothetical protein
MTNTLGSGSRLTATMPIKNALIVTRNGTGWGANATRVEFEVMISDTVTVSTRELPSFAG